MSAISNSSPTFSSRRTSCPPTSRSSALIGPPGTVECVKADICKIHCEQYVFVFYMAREESEGLEMPVASGELHKLYYDL